MSVCILDPGPNNEWQQVHRNNKGSEELVKNQHPMHNLAAVDTTRAHFSELDRREALPVTSPQEVLLGRVEHGEAVQGHSGSWLRVTPMVDDVGKAVCLNQKCSVDQRATTVAWD